MDTEQGKQNLNVLITRNTWTALTNQPRPKETGCLSQQPQGKSAGNYCDGRKCKFILL